MNQDALKGFNTTTKIFDFIDYREYLIALYKHLKSSERRYSYLQMAEDFGFSRTNVLHLIIKGKRSLSLKGGERIISRLQLSKNETKYFKTLIEYQNSRISEDREKKFRKLVKIKSKTIETPQVQAQLEFFNEWYHIVIYQLSFIDDGFKNDANMIAKWVYPNIRPEQAKKSIELLVELGMVKLDNSTQKLKPLQRRMATSDEIASIAVVRYHQKMIELAKESITHCHEDIRDISAISFSIPHKMINQIKDEISQFRKKILTMTDSVADTSEEVYQMNIQLFPTSSDKKKKED